MPNSRQWSSMKARQAMYAAFRSFLRERGYQEVETPALVPAPGMEPHISAFAVTYVPEMDSGCERPLYLHTSPEYAMKRLVADGSGPIFQICKVFRNGEVSRLHNPEFTMLELYRPGADYGGIMQELELSLAHVEAAVGGGKVFGEIPYERMPVCAAFERFAGIDLQACPDARSLSNAARGAGVATPADAGFDDAFFRVFLERVEPSLGRDRPVYLIDYPASMASLSRLKAADPAVAERFELYVRGTELANGFSELTDAAEQRRRLEAEQAARKAAGRPVYPLDEDFIAAVSKLPPCAGVAVGLDRVLMLMLGAESIDEVLLFPGREVL